MPRSATSLVTRQFFGLFIAALGGAFAFVGWFTLAEFEPPNGGVSTSAVVVGSIEERVLIDGIARPNFAPVYEYEDLDGQIQRVTDHLSADVRPLAVGSTVEVSYLPGEPNSVLRTDVDHGWLQWFVVGGGFTAGIGVLMVLFSVFGAVRNRTRR
jgi:hypothetical protein